MKQIKLPTYEKVGELRHRHAGKCGALLLLVGPVLISTLLQGQAAPLR
jgi:hypothetical protein